MYHTMCQPCTISTPYHLPIMYYTKHKPCTTTSESTMYKYLYQTLHQPYTSTYTKPCINHEPQPILYASTINHVFQVPIMYHTMYQPCTLTMYINTYTIPCNIYHIPYTMKCVSTIYHITLNHAMYHKISLKYMSISQRCASKNEP
jgi:hypothetical protein